MLASPRGARVDLRVRVVGDGVPGRHPRHGCIDPGRTPRGGVPRLLPLAGDRAGSVVLRPQPSRSRCASPSTTAAPSRWSTAPRVVASSKYTWRAGGAASAPRSWRDVGRGTAATRPGPPTALVHRLPHGRASFRPEPAMAVIGAPAPPSSAQRISAPRSLASGASPSRRRRRCGRVVARATLLRRAAGTSTIHGVRAVGRANSPPSLVVVTGVGLGGVPRSHGSHGRRMRDRPLAPLKSG